MEQGLSANPSAFYRKSPCRSGMITCSPKKKKLFVLTFAFLTFQMMYRQRLFMETAPKLIQGFHSAGPGEFQKQCLNKIESALLFFLLYPSA